MIGLWNKGIGVLALAICLALSGVVQAQTNTVGLNIGLPFEQFPNPYISEELNFEFHYFFMRKFWFAYLAKAVILFPGGFGTLDEMFELLTLVQTGKMRKRLPVLLYGSEFWKDVINFDALVRNGMIEAGDLNLIHRTDSVDEAYEWTVAQLGAHALDNPGATL